MAHTLSKLCHVYIKGWEVKEYLMIVYWTWHILYGQISVRCTGFGWVYFFA